MVKRSLQEAGTERKCLKAPDWQCSLKQRETLLRAQGEPLVTLDPRSLTFNFPPQAD